LWKSFRAEDLATPQAFQRDPKLVWEWYDWRRQLLAKVEPNAGHYALAEFETGREGRFTLVTQNVDGLHDRAGSRNVLKVHGDIWDVRCLDCRRTVKDERAPLPELPPRCDCGGMLRPGVVWFGEALPVDVFEAAQIAVEQCDVLLVAGTSAVVYPAAGLVPLARAAGARVIEVNLEETPMSGTVGLALRGKSGEILPQILS
jgi:NAD-dependent deacetylase